MLLDGSNLYSEWVRVALILRRDDQSLLDVDYTSEAV